MTLLLIQGDVGYFECNTYHVTMLGWLKKEEKELEELELEEDEQF